tara:strand:- start:79 stop:873 length:795 start_codon:yes stop_codon:yes gene_type:complete
MNNSIGFIILRQVTSATVEQYWRHCYDCIRKFYPENKILIIDDDSDLNHISDKVLYNTTIIYSEFPKRGELLPYYYYLNNKLFDTAVILHDSAFLNQKLNFNVDKYKFLWHIDHGYDQTDDEKRIIGIFNDEKLNNFYINKDLWNGCFGGMSIITHDYLSYVNEKYNISKLLDVILNRYNRCSFERVIACLLDINNGNEFFTKLCLRNADPCFLSDTQSQLRESLLGDESLFGHINQYVAFGYCNYENKDMYLHLPLIKTWVGR